MRLLARREHSRKELANKLLASCNPPRNFSCNPPRNSSCSPASNPASKHRLQFPPEELTRQQVLDAIEELLNKLEAKDLLSDQRFAETLTRQYVRKGKGPVALRQAYQAHQLDAEITRPLLDWLAPLWEEQVWRVRNKRFGDQPPADRKEAAKMQRFLAARGFTAEQINRAIFGA